ncbi:hypothetical protein [Streptomyces caniscabiei]|uniref:hypothetical protein n=1 Tax=Streptomyces caniscabiei TaxID=2746961 RepID=UPI000765940D|nr:hypothetical protein [Streptomyces caniscabiei]
MTPYATGHRNDNDDANDSDVRMWAFPYLTLATIDFIVAVLVLMAVLPEHRLELGLTAVLVAMGIQRQRSAARTRSASPASPESDKIPSSRS